MSLRVQSVSARNLAAQALSQRVPQLPPGTRVYRWDGFRQRPVVSWQWHTRNADRALVRGNRREASEQVLDARALVEAAGRRFPNRARRQASDALNQLARDVRKGRVGAGELQGHFTRVLDVLNRRRTTVVADRMEPALRVPKSADAMVGLQLVAPKV